jgi:beta-ureidopropionase
MRVGFVQLNSEMMQVEDNVDRALRILDRMNADLVVLPELFNTGYNFLSRREVEKVSEPIPVGFTTEKLLETSRRSGMTIVAGIAEKSNDNYYNSAVVVGNKYIGKYRKVHLFSKEKKLFNRGREFKVFGKIGVMICFDWVYPESARVLMLKGAEIIAHPAALVLPYCPDSMKTRSLENRVFSVTADRVGGERGLRYIGSSQIVDTTGRILCRASEAKEEFAIRTIQLKDAKNKRFSPSNKILQDRMVDAYRDLTRRGLG